MKYVGELSNPEIYTCYVTGSLVQKNNNQALQKMLRKINDGGMNAFLNDKELGKFAKGLQSSFVSDGFINKDNTLTSCGNEILKTGKSWHGLKGAFFITVLKYKGELYLLDAELVSDKNENNQGDGKNSGEFKNRIGGLSFRDDEYTGAETVYRQIEFDKNWARCRRQPTSASVHFVFDYEKTECTVSVSWKLNSKDRCTSFTTREESHFAILKQTDAMKLLEECEREEGVFNFSEQDKTSIQIKIDNAESIAEKKWINRFFERGSFSLDGAQLQNEKWAGKIEDVRLYIDQNDKETAFVLLNEYLICEAERSYLGYEETGRLVSDFQNLFTSPNDVVSACPAIMKSTKDIYDELVEHAKELSEKNPLAYLHLQAYIDLSPADTIKPYIEKKYTVNLSNQELSFMDLIGKVFGSERNVENILLLSKYTATNGRNARAVKLFSECIAKKFGVQPTLITTNHVLRPSANKEFAESDNMWYEKMKKSIRVIEKSIDEIKSVHDRYYKVVRTDGRNEWWVLTGELDSLRFGNDNPRIREDVSVTEKGTVKEMTFSRIKESGVPVVVVKLMEVK